MMEKFEFEITGEASNWTVILREKSTRREKSFHIAAPTSAERIAVHMNSLTDDLCSSWFMAPREKKKKSSETQAKDSV